MQAALIVHLTLDDNSDIQSEADHVEEILVKNGVAVDSVKPWARQGTIQPTISDIANALPATLTQTTPQT